MSLEEWQHGLRTGLQHEYMPAMHRRNQEWFRACKEIIDRCVAPDMQHAALSMLERAMREAEGITDGGLPFAVVTDDGVPPDEVHVKNGNGVLLARIVGIK